MSKLVQQAVGQLPWGHNLVLLTRLKQPEQRLAEKITTPVRAELVEALCISIRKAFRQAQGERKIGIEPDRIVCAHSARFKLIIRKRSVHA